MADIIVSSALFQKDRRASVWMSVLDMEYVQQDSIVRRELLIQFHAQMVRS